MSMGKRWNVFIADEDGCNDQVNQQPYNAFQIMELLERLDDLPDGEHVVIRPVPSLCINGVKVAGEFTLDQCEAMRADLEPRGIDVSW